MRSIFLRVFVPLWLKTFLPQARPFLCLGFVRQEPGRKKMPLVKTPAAAQIEVYMIYWDDIIGMNWDELGWTGMIGTRMTRMKGKRFFRFAQEYTDKGRIGRASLCFGLKVICFTPILLSATTASVRSIETKHDNLFREPWTRAKKDALMKTPAAAQGFGKFSLCVLCSLACFAWKNMQAVFIVPLSRFVVENEGW